MLYLGQLVTEVANYYVQSGGEVTATFLDLSKAFDKCLFDKLFEQMLAKGIPAIVVRALVFGYQEQKGQVRLAVKIQENSHSQMEQDKARF